MGLFRRKPRAEMTKFYIASDLHGSMACFNKLMRAKEWYEAEAILVAGDLTGKMVVPVVQNGNGFRSMFHGQEHRVGDDELQAHMDEIDSVGLYAYRTTEDEMAELEGDPGRVDEIFHRLVLERVERWMEIGEARLAAAGINCYVVAGNDDYPEVDDILRQGERIKFVDGEVMTIEGEHELLGLGVSNITPWHAPRDISEAEIAGRLEALASRLANPETAIFMVHVPPKDSQIDLAPKIDEDLRPVGGGGIQIGVGSTAVREAIEKYQPLLSVHGHIHESPGVGKIGRTNCINPGSEYGQAILRGAIVNLTPNKVAGKLFVSG